MSANLKLALALTLWAAMVAGAFWHYDVSYMRPVTAQAGAIAAHPGITDSPPLTTLTSTTGAVPLTSPGVVTVINFWNPHCICSQDNEPVVRGLVREFASQRVQWITVGEYRHGKGDKAAEIFKERGLPPMAFVEDHNGQLARRFGVYATPGAVIINRAGKLVYTGGYNAARFCHSLPTAWVREALHAVCDGGLPPHPSTPFYGCRIPQ